MDAKILPKDGKFKFITENPAYPEFRSELLAKGIRVFSFNPPNDLVYFLLSTFQIMLPVALIMGFLVFYQRGMDPKENEITTKDSKVKVFVIPTNEELMIARHAWAATAGR